MHGHALDLTFQQIPKPLQSRKCEFEHKDVTNTKE